MLGSSSWIVQPAASNFSLAASEGAKLLGLRLLDHLLVGDGRYVSPQERGAFA
jgi:DNA repair protein RadC